MTGKDDNHLPYDLENMSIPELEALLHRDFCASDGAAPDVDYIMAIAEVIQKKEQALPNYQPMDAEKAWEEFQSFTIQRRAKNIPSAVLTKRMKKRRFLKRLNVFPSRRRPKAPTNNLLWPL